MNAIEKKMVEILRTLRDHHGVTAVKTSFETEDVQLFELLRTMEIALTAGVGLLVKLGGCEAWTDIRTAKAFGAGSILGPMIESRFALEKYLEMCERSYSAEERTEMKFLINIETTDGCDKIDQILSAYNLNMLHGVVLGRTDLCNDLNTKDVDSAEILKVARELFTKVKEQSLRCLVGGGVTPKSAPFMQQLEGLIDGFETRKIVFTDYSKAKYNMEEGIRLALQYELCWFELKQQYYGDRFHEDNGKIKGLTQYSLS
ncbi:MAG: hypothetical protein GX434_10530 [Peptococcaceae bacterium]|nr:hypothetical protein [Peptococcaceae bacterium]